MKQPDQQRTCKHHGITTFFYRGEYGYRCRKCASKSVQNNRKNNKLKLLAIKGGKCCICGYNRYVGALEFHHLDRKEKLFSLSNSGIPVKFSKALEESEKCVLLCSNCHREVEAGIAKVPSHLIH